MLKSDYEWSDKELSSFYYRVATKHPTEQNKGRGVYFYQHIENKDILNGENGLHVLYCYQKKFEEHNMFSYARVLKKVIYGARMEIIRTKKVLFVPNEEMGNKLLSGQLNRKFREICNMFDSILEGKPSVSARYFFGM